VSLPKREETKARKIEITGHGSDAKAIDIESTGKGKSKEANA
jgi:hypothetical protein